MDNLREEKNPEKFDLTLPKRSKTRYRQQNGGYSVHMSSVALIIGFWTILFISNALLKVRVEPAYIDAPGNGQHAYILLNRTCMGIERGV